MKGTPNENCDTLASLTAIFKMKLTTSRRRQNRSEEKENSGNGMSYKWAKELRCGTPHLRKLSEYINHLLSLPVLIPESAQKCPSLFWRPAYYSLFTTDTNCD